MLFLLATLPAHAEQVYAEPVRAGLPVDAVFDVYADEAGWIWIASPAGLFRYDGRAARRWGDGAYGVGKIVTVQDERALVIEDWGRLTWLEGTGRSAVTGPDGQALSRVQSAVVVGDTVWIAWNHRVYRRGSAWVDVGPLDAWRLWPAADGGVWVSVDGAALHLAATGAEVERVPMPDPAALVDPGPGAAWIVGSDGTVVHQTDGRAQVVAHLPVDGVTDAVLREGTLWISLATALYGVRPDGTVEATASGGGGPEGSLGAVSLALDPEGSLWVGQHAGLRYLPSPETRIWTDLDGLPERGGRAIAETNGRIWVTSWHPLAVIEPDGKVGHPVYQGAWTEAYADTAGHTWMAGERAWGGGIAQVYRLDDETAPPVDLPKPVTTIWDLAGGEGGLWVATDDGVWQIRDGAPSPVPRPADRPAVVSQVLEDRTGRLWAADRAGICHIPAAEAATGTWTCDPTEPGTWVGDMEEVEGQIWASTAEGAGVLQYGPAGFTQVPGARDLDSRRLSWMAPSPRGGLWLAGHTAPVRVRPSPDGWTVLEHLGRAQGLRLRGAGQILELADGTLWVTGDGVTRIPASARHPTPDPPPPVLVSAVVDGVPLGDEVGAPASAENLLELEYAVASYREPDRLRFRIRSAPDDAWSTPVDRPSFRLVDLPPGDYQFEVQASLEGGAWSASSAPVHVRVPRPPWLRTPALVAYAVVLGSFVGAFAWGRRAVRVRLESERNRIAMDLHDAVGSGLGSASILATLAGSEDVAPEARRGFAEELGHLVESLGEAVQDAVWSLRRDAGAPEALLRHLEVRGRALFAEGDTRFHVEAPPRWPRGELSLIVRREVQLFASEALHNAARHAHARNVWLRLTPGKPWILTIEDDGVGLDAGLSSQAGGGNGLTSMRARAARIGATARIEARPGGGTRVELRFGARLG